MTILSDFVRAIHDRRNVRVEFASKKHGGAILVRECAPMDFGPCRKPSDDRARFQLWDYGGDDTSGPHPLLKLPEDVMAIEVLDSTFYPDFVTWCPNWTVPRDWGPYS